MNKTEKTTGEEKWIQQSSTSTVSATSCLFKDDKLHSKIEALEMSKCITCLERFPALNVKAVSPDSVDTECVCCRQDEHIPKVYFSSINMDPGPVPSELLVC